MLAGKKILVGVTGGIAAYKAAILVRLLVKKGAEVKVIMTTSAHSFITPLTLSTLSKNPVYTELVKNAAGEWVNHVEFGLWADLFVVAPASANSIAKFANGICDNLLTAVYLSAKCPVFIAPAMDLDMYIHPATQANIKRLQSFGNHLIEATYGELASGLIGQGRLAEPEEIVEKVLSYFSVNQALKGKKALVTAGPTREAIDPVRFISNHSTGKMGYAIAEQLAAEGAEVVLVSGPVNMKLINPVIQLVTVESAEEMFNGAAASFDNADIVVLAAAVADYTPEKKSETKIKKKEDVFALAMTKTVDIAQELGKRKTKQVIVGFALETDNEQANAVGKLQRKNFDLIVLNSLKDTGAGFGHDTNRVTIINKNLQEKKFDLKSKFDVAKDIVAEIKAEISRR